MKKVIVIFIIFIISSFSYYGKVDENGEKVIDFKSVAQSENTKQDKIVEETREDREDEIKEDIKEKVENVIEQEQKVQQEETKEEEKTEETKQEIKQNIKIEPEKRKDENTESKNNTKNEKTTETSKKETKVEEKKTTENKQTNTKNTPKCSHSSNGWYNTEADAIAVYNSEIKKWEDKWVNYEIDNDTYYNNCPYGYEVFSCPYCEKWTINLFRKN